MFKKEEESARRNFEEELNRRNDEIGLSSHDRDVDGLQCLAGKAHSRLLIPVIFDQTKVPRAEGYTGSKV